MQQSGQLDGSLEVLIPKVSDVERTGHIREIDVFDGSEKILAKVPTNRQQIVFKEMLYN